MIRDQELGRYLRCIVEELGGPVRAEVTSSYGQKVIDAIILVLQRYRAQLQHDSPLSEEMRQRWLEINAAFRSVVPQADAGRSPGAGITSRTLEHIDAQTSLIQTRLQDPDALRRFATALGRRTPSARAWMQDVSRSLHDILQRIEDDTRRSEASHAVPSVASDMDGLRRSLNAYLQKRYPALPAESILTMTVSPGGQTKRTVLFQIVPNSVLPQRLVLRQDMAFNITGTVVTDEFWTLKRVFEFGMPVPEPILAEADDSILGGKFMIMREVEGAPPAGAPFPEERAYLGSAMGPNFGHEVAGALARLHGSSVIEDVDASAVDRVRRVEEFEQKWRALGNPALSVIADMGLAWLLAHPLSRRPRCLVHGDVGAHNMMARDGHLAALLDWELCKPGDPAEDLSQVKMMLLPDVMPWEQFKASYIAQGGLAAACDDHPMAYYCIWTYLKHLGMNTSLWDYFMSGERNDAPAASIAGFFIDRLLLYIARALVDALDTVA